MHSRDAPDLRARLLLGGANGAGPLKPRAACTDHAASVASGLPPTEWRPSPCREFAHADEVPLVSGYPIHQALQTAWTQMIDELVKNRRGRSTLSRFTQST